MVLGILILATAWAVFAWITQLRAGLAVTGLRDIPGGAPWGLYITNFIYFAGLTAGGIAIASTIRLFKLKDYIPLARMAEIASVFSLMMAGASIIVDLGRPERVLNMIWYLPQRIGSSPLVWDMASLTIYLVFAVAYLYVEMREDLAKLAKKGRLEWLYRILLPAYTPGERERVVKIVWWASILNLPLMLIVEAVAGWIFGLMPARPGWYGAIMAPYFVVGAVLSGVAALAVIATACRALFGWQEYIKPAQFKGLGVALASVSIIYLYFVLVEVVTVRWGGPIGELRVSLAVAGREFAGLFWFQIVALVTAFAVSVIGVALPKVSRIWTTAASSVLLLIALWISRFLIVVPSLTRPGLSYQTGSYSPTWVEWSIVGGTFAAMALLFLLFTKLFPIVPFTEMREAGTIEA